MSSKVSFSSSEHFLIFSFSLQIASSISSILWLSLVIFISPYSNLASVTLYLFCRERIFSTSFSSLSNAFSADFSSCFMFSPTVSSFSSIPFRFFSASSALSSPLFSSASCTPSFRLSSSGFCSLSTAILMVERRFLSNSSMVTSLLRQVFSTTLTAFRTVSALLLVSASLVTVLQRLSAPFLSSSALNLLELLISLLQRLGSLGQLVVGLIVRHLQVLHFLSEVSDVAIRLICAAARLPGCLLEPSDCGVQLVRLRLQRLHLFPDCVHPGVVSGPLLFRPELAHLS